MSSPDANFIEDATQEFYSTLRTLVPLEDVTQFYDESAIRTVAADEKTTFVEKMLADISEAGLDGLAGQVNAVRRECQKIIDEYVTKNKDHMSQTRIFFMNKLDVVRANLKNKVEASLLQNPDIDLESFEFPENEMTEVIAILEHYRSHGVINFYKEQKKHLQKNMENLRKQMIEIQRRHQEVKACALKMSRKLKCYLANCQGQISKNVLKNKAKSIYDYLENNGSVLHAQQMEVLQEAMNVLDEEEGETVSLEDAIGWANVLDEHLNSHVNSRTSQGENKLESFKTEANENETDVNVKLEPGDLTFLENQCGIIESESTSQIVQAVELMGGVYGESVSMELEVEDSDESSGSGEEEANSERHCFNVACRQNSLGDGHSLIDENNQFRIFVKDIEALECTRNEDIYSELSKKYMYSVVSTSAAAWYPYVARYRDQEMRLAAIKEKQDEFRSKTNRCLSTVAIHILYWMGQRSVPIGVILCEDGHYVFLVVHPDKRGSGWRAFVKDSFPINQTTISSFAVAIVGRLNISEVTLIAEPPSESKVTARGCMKDAMKAVGDLLDGRLLNSSEQSNPDCSQLYDLKSTSIKQP